MKNLKQIDLSTKIFPEKDGIALPLASLDDLSSKSSSHVFVKSIDDPVLSSFKPSDLSVWKMSITQFKEFTLLCGDNVPANMLINVDSDYVETFGMQISNVAMGDNEEYLGIAATKTYVDSEISSLPISEISSKAESAMLSSSAAVTAAAAAAALADQVSAELQEVKPYAAGSYSVVSSIIGHTLPSATLALSTLQDLPSLGDGNKVFFKAFDVPELSAEAKRMDLSVQKMTIQEYGKLIEQTEGALPPNSLYIVDSDIVDALGEQISNVAMGDNEEYLGIAATDTYVKEKVLDKIQAALSCQPVQDLSSKVNQSGIGSINLECVVSAFFSFIQELAK